LVPGERSAELVGQGDNLSGDGFPNGFSAMASEWWTVLDSGFGAVPVHAGQVQQHREPCRALDERADRRAAQPEDQIALPMARNGAVLGFGGREVEVLRLVAAGKTNADVADELVISINT
jgi:hypothetical protein